MFVLLFKFGDNFAQSLLRPFLGDIGYDAVVRGGILGTIGMIMTLTGSVVGSAATNVIGLGPALWIFGALQMFSNLGYVLLANTPPNNTLLYSAMSFENLTQGLGTGAFSVLLFRLTQRRFSATQYALFSTLFGLGRIVSGPVAGFTVDAVGWSTFFLGHHSARYPWHDHARPLRAVGRTRAYVPRRRRRAGSTGDPPRAVGAWSAGRRRRLLVRGCTERAAGCTQNTAGRPRPGFRLLESNDRNPSSC